MYGVSFLTGWYLGSQPNISLGPVPRTSYPLALSFSSISSYPSYPAPVVLASSGIHTTNVLISPVLHTQSLLTLCRCHSCCCSPEKSSVFSLKVFLIYPSHCQNLLFLCIFHTPSVSHGSPSPIEPHASPPSFTPSLTLPLSEPFLHSKHTFLGLVVFSSSMLAF